MSIGESALKHKKHLCKLTGLDQIISEKLWKSHFFSWAIHHSSSSLTRRVRNTGVQHSRLPVLLIKHVYYCMSSHQSAQSESNPLSFVKRMCYEWVAPLRFFFTLGTYSLFMANCYSCYSPHFLHVPSCCLWYSDASLIPQPRTPLFFSLPPSTDSLYLTRRPIPLHQQQSETSDDWD